MDTVAIILDGEQKSALAAVRSLGKAGVTVIVGGTRSTGIGLQSRYATHTFVYPDPKSDRATFLVAVKNQIAHWHNQGGQAPVLYCFSDATQVSIIESMDTFSGEVNFPRPSIDSFKVAYDKRKTAELATRLGIPAIASHNLAEAEKLQYPVVIKPPKSVAWKNDRGTFKTADFVFSAQALTEKYTTLKNIAGEEPLIQDFIMGEEYGVELLCKNGEVLAIFMHRRIRSLSPAGGAAVVKQTAPLFHLTEKMRDDSIALAKALVWTGPIMVEWKVQRRFDRPFLMEINGRFWGSLPLAVQAGVDFPFMYYQLALNQSTPLSPDFVPANIRTRHFWGDVRWLTHVLFDRTNMRSIVYPARAKALQQFFMEFFRSRGDVWAGNDSWPSVMEIVDIIRR